ncbi:prepilin-type N-terminal cleavage/methylation domain-containing protein [Coraliomargarita algicola]|uniref:Prepilin-type N-terminal cleavage/methylation domain-containing protein n=1 Tax=Coraliomargarita algicola TaxID=3092156 RepID=A0ABZ0RGH7_9BACT|nr:prepilin-type N-terminal cleavage/methylation domain-containing protein [Coraliomargarita sp. J2-16]WPJ94516.1 prepilin-type N-terminal cleavage/methylation domain-containing protein [Coraliomargarita sp. J2-16]
MFIKRYSIHSRCHGFTLVEVVVALSIMAIALSSSALCLRMGMIQYDSARSASYATQILQDEAESLRLENWTFVESLPTQASFAQSLSQDSKFSFYRQVAQAGPDDEIVNVWLIANWTGLKGEMHEIKLLMKYAKNGTYDYLYGINS